MELTAGSKPASWVGKLLLINAESFAVLHDLSLGALAEILKNLGWTQNEPQYFMYIYIYLE